MPDELTSSLRSSWMAENKDFEPFPIAAEQNSNNKEDGVFVCRRRWEALRGHWERATEGRNNSDAWLNNKIVPMYSEEGRFYHNLVHLEEMLGYLDLILRKDKKDGIDYQILVLTIFFHDVIYDPKSATNEEDSAALFEEFWNDSSSSERDDDDDSLKERVVRYILATKHHTSTDDDVIAQLLLDIDMAVLGKARDAYSNYAWLIRKEYMFVPADMYCKKRAQVLKGFLENPIFGTPCMRDALEEPARDNLKYEIECLEHGVIPSCVV